MHTRLITAVALVLSTLSASVANADVYEVGQDGRIERIDSLPPRLENRPVSRKARPVPVSARAAAFRPAVAKAGQIYAVSPALIDAIAHHESRYSQHAVSAAGAIGIMQLMPQTARTIGVDPQNAAANIRGGTAYLRYLLNRYDGDIVCTIAAYNAGPARVTKSRCIPNFPETRAYVAKVLDHLANAAD